MGVPLQIGDEQFGVVMESSLLLLFMLLLGHTTDICALSVFMSDDSPRDREREQESSLVQERVRRWPAKLTTRQKVFATFDDPMYRRAAPRAQT